MKIRYDAKLKLEEETALQLMQMHAVMTKAHDTLIKDSNQQKVEIKRLRDKESRLYETIHSLEKDIQSHKKEIREREETITDKEKRIFELKKKNQVSFLLAPVCSCLGTVNQTLATFCFLIILTIFLPHFTPARRSWRSSASCWITRSKS